MDCNYLALVQVSSQQADATFVPSGRLARCSAENKLQAQIKWLLEPAGVAVWRIMKVLLP